MLPNRLSIDHPARSRRPHTRSESWLVEEGNSTNLEFVEQIQLEAEEELREVLGLYTDSSSDEELSDQHRYLSNLEEVLEGDTMSYPYPKYNDEADEEAHMHAFLTTWQANHVSQRLSKADADKSKITKFGLSLDGQLGNWYSQHEGEFE